MHTLQTQVSESIPLRADAGGTIRIGNTRVTLDLVVRAFEDGATPEEIVLAFDTLTLPDVYVVLGYYLRHRIEVQAYLKEREEKADALRDEINRRAPMQEFRERLRARQRASGLIAPKAS